jgi:hypothetical protein
MCAAPAVRRTDAAGVDDGVRLATGRTACAWPSTTVYSGRSASTSAHRVSAESTSAPRCRGAGSRGGTGSAPARSRGHSGGRPARWAAARRSAGPRPKF